MKVGVLLAAGASRRMGRTKALLERRGVSYLALGVRHLWSVCDRVVVVLGADATRVRATLENEIQALVATGRLHDEVTAARRHGAPALEVRFVVNRAWARGMYGSVRAGLRAARIGRPEAVIVLPVDHPFVSPATVRVLAAAMDAALGAYRGTRAARARFAYAVVPRYRGKRGHPVVLSGGLAAAIAADARARDLSDAVRSRARLVGYLDVRDPGVVRNRNTPKD
ncbi:MAG TPA: NTP transferase domain-containing protein [Dongiaceae bacterium]|nr:NTP transferase domain-containing protein [Dongiaceae bacterium]